MWHLDNIYHGKERKDMSWCPRTSGFVFPCAEYRHGPNTFNVFKAVEDALCSFTVLDHTRQDCYYLLIILIYKIKSKLVPLHHFWKNSLSQYSGCILHMLQLGSLNV